MNAAELALLAATGVGAGIANTVAGGGTFLSYPVLVALGVPPVGANVTSAVGLISGYAGGAVSYRRELQGQGRRFRTLLPAAVGGAVAGAILLLSTPTSVFQSIVPFLVLAATGMLILQPRVKRLLSQRSERRAAQRAARGGSAVLVHSEVGVALHVGIFLAAVYATYFGAGLGVVLLAVLGSLVVDDLQRLNGLRTFQSLLMKCIGVAIFVFSGLVYWPAAAVLLVTAYAGGSLGAVLTRRMPETLLRATVIICGLVVGVVLLVR